MTANMATMLPVSEIAYLVSSGLLGCQEGGSKRKREKGTNTQRECHGKMNKI